MTSVTTVTSALPQMVLKKIDRWIVLRQSVS